MGQIISQFIADYGELLVEGVRDTIIMTAVATLLAYVIGLPVGVLLITSAKKGIRPNATLNTVLGWIVNIVRSVPFIILLVAIIPLTRLIVGTSLGVPGAIVPLVITAAPFVARGLGDIAIRYGYQRYQYDVMTVAVILCVILVQIVQTIGDVISNHIDHHER